MMTQNEKLQRMVIYRNIAIGVMILAFANLALMLTDIISGIAGLIIAVFIVCVNLINVSFMLRVRSIQTEEDIRRSNGFDDEIWYAAQREVEELDQLSFGILPQKSKVDNKKSVLKIDRREYRVFSGWTVGKLRTEYGPMLRITDDHIPYIGTMRITDNHIIEENCVVEFISRNRVPNIPIPNAFVPYYDRYEIRNIEALVHVKIEEDKYKQRELELKMAKERAIKDVEAKVLNEQIKEIVEKHMTQKSIGIVKGKK